MILYNGIAGMLLGLFEAYRALGHRAKLHSRALVWCEGFVEEVHGGCE